MSLVFTEGGLAPALLAKQLINPVRDKDIGIAARLRIAIGSENEMTAIGGWNCVRAAASVLCPENV